jgi:NAD(P)-dependent dehydrogenase (short-subunit alcohol dehydrogenase family)
MKFAIVTGASRGIGRAAALELARRNVALALIGRPSEEQDATLELARANGAPEARVFACDLADPAGTERVAAALARELPAIDVLINNAGIAPRLSVEETSPAVWDETFAVNLRAAFVLTRAVLPGMLKARRGRILHVGSISSTGGTARLAAYCASKWALVGFMKSLAAELSDSGVMTLAVLPGSTDTRMLEGSGFPPRMTAEDVARTLAHYALDAPNAHNGAAIEMFGV